MMFCMCGHLRYDGLYVWINALRWFVCVDTCVTIVCMCGHLRYDCFYVWTLAL